MKGTTIHFNFSTLLIISFFFISVEYVSSQNVNSNIFRSKYIDEEIFVTTSKNKPIQELLDIGYRAFILDSNTVFNTSEFIFIKTFLKNNPNDFIAFINNANLNTLKINKYFKNNSLLIEPNSHSLSEDLLSHKKQVLVFNNFNIKNSPITYVKMGVGMPIDAEKLFIKGDPSNHFTLFEFNPNYKQELTDSNFINNTLKEAVLNYLRKTGKFANFICTNNPEMVIQLKKEIPLTIKLKTTNENGGYEKNIRWKHQPFLQSFGVTHISSDVFRFNEQRNQYLGKLDVEPYKEGFNFIPELFTFNTNNYSLFKNMQAKKIEIDENLDFYLPLHGDSFSYNILEIDKNIQYHKETKKKSVAFFDGENNVFYFKALNSDFEKRALTVSFFAKPKHINNNYSILSTNNGFTIKIRKGHLCLTFPGVIDIVDRKTELKKDEWQHLAITYKAGEYVKFYVNGILTDFQVVKQYELKTDDNKYILGNDQWGELYNGNLKDVALWSRVLTDQEINRVFNGEFPVKIKNNNKEFQFLMVLSIALVIGTIVLLFLKRRKKSISSNRFKTFKKNSDSGSIKCFGTFEITNNKGVNILNDLPFKQKIFLFVILYYTMEEKGISPQKLSDIMWPGANAKRAKNIRSTYLQNIRANIPNKLLKIKYENKKWFIRADDDLFIDLFQYNQLNAVITESIKKDLPIKGDELNSFLSILEKGELIADIQSEIVDNCKSTIHSKILDVLEDLLNLKTSKFSQHQLLRIADTLFVFDVVNEVAYTNKNRILEEENKTKALKFQQQFKKDWENYFNEPYKK